MDFFFCEMDFLDYNFFFVRMKNCLLLFVENCFLMGFGVNFKFLFKCYVKSFWIGIFYFLCYLGYG